MGRPKGSSNKPKEVQTSEVNENVAESVSIPVMVRQETADKAYSICFDPKTNKYSAVELKFDFLTGTFGGLKVIEQNTNRNIVTDRFHVLISQNLL